jgi:DNA polymerase phi
MALFDIFWKLADDEAARSAGVKELLTLLQVERRAAPDKPSPLENMQYSLKRLVRGLGSSRGGARQGFSAALTEVLLHFPEVPTSQVTELANQSLALSGEANKQEKKDFFMGRIFFALVIAKSGRLGQLSAHETTIMVDQLIQLGQEKPLLREACFETLGLLTTSASKIEGAVRDVVISRVTKLFPSDSAWDCDQLNLALTISTAGPLVLSQFPTSVRQAPLKASKHKTALTESTRVYPAVHSVWPRLLDILFAEPSLANLASFWLSVVDGELFNNPRPKCKHLGFCLFELILNRLTNQKEVPKPTANTKKKKRKKPEDEQESEKEEEADKEEEAKIDAGPVALKAIAALFSKHFIRTLVNNLSAKATQLREAALHTRNALLRAAKGRPGVALVMANHLGGSVEGANFDIRTKCKTVALLLGQLNEDGVAEYLKSLFASFSHPAQIVPTADEVASPELFAERQQKQTEINRAGQIEQLYAMSKNSHLPRVSQQGWLSEILEFFLRHGYFQDSTVVLSPKTKELCRQKFFTLITDLLPGRISAPRGDKGEIVSEEAKTAKAAQYEDLWALKAHQIWNKLALQHELVTPLSPTDLSVREKTYTLVNTITKRVAKLRGLAKKTTNKEKADAHLHTAKIGKLHALQLLLLHLSLLQLKAGDLQPTQLLQEVEECYTKLFDTKAGVKPESEDEPKPVEVLVDILLALLVTESCHIREVANQVMQAFNHSLTPKALQSLVEVLVAKERTPGEEDEASEEEGDEGESVVSEPEEAEEDEEDMSDNSEEELVDLAGLQEMLAADPEPGFSKAADDDDDEDATMDNYDKALADMMRLRQAKKNAGKDLRRLSLNFKLRVLDLLAVFVKKNPENPLILDLLKPMLDAFHAARGGTENVVLHDRLLVLFRKLCKPSEYPCIGDGAGCVPTETFKSLFEELLRRAQKTVHRDDLSLVSLALLFLVRMWVPLGDAQGSTAEASWVVAQYSLALKNYLTTKKSALNTKFFTDFIARFPVLGFALTEPLIQLSYSGTKEFQRVEAFALLRVLFQSKGDLKSQAVSSLGPSLGKALIAALTGRTAEEKMDKRAKIALQTVNDYVTLVKKTSGKVDLGTGVSQALAVAAGSDKLKKFINNLVRNAKLDFDFALLKSKK